DIHRRLPVIITPGVSSILGMGKLPTPVDDSEITSIRQILSADVDSEPCRYVAIGEKVRVQSGPLQGLVGLVVQSNGNNRLVVSVTLLMRSVSVKIDRCLVQPLQEGHEHLTLQNAPPV